MRRLQRRLWAAAKQSSGRRFHALYDRIHRGDVLWEAWERVKVNRGAAGVDRITLAYVQEEYGVERLLAELQADLRAGTYRPAPARRVDIPKPQGGKRPLGIPTGPANCAVAQAGREVPESFVTVTHPFHPLSGQRLRVLFERKLAGRAGGQLRGRAAGLADGAAGLDRPRSGGGGCAADL